MHIDTSVCNAKLLFTKNVGKNSKELIFNVTVVCFTVMYDDMFHVVV